MKLLARLVALLSGIAAALGGLATATCLVLVGVSVISRYVFNEPLPWIDRVAGWLVVALVLLAAPEAQRRFEHIGVDILVGNASPGWARASRLAGTLSVAAVGAILTVAGWEAVSFSRMVGLATEIEAVPLWWVQMLLPIGASVLCLVAVVQSLVLLTGGTPEHQPTGEDKLSLDTLARGE